MDAIYIHTRLDSTTLHLPEVQPLLGKQVEIIVREQTPKKSATEQDWNDFYQNAGTNLVDADLVNKYRQFDRDHSSAPPL